LEKKMNRNESQCVLGEESFARSRLYRLLALGFSFPNRELHARFLDGSYAEQIRSSLALCAPELADAESLGGLRTSAPFEIFEASYLSAFETDMPKPSISLYEGSYVQQGRRPMLLLEVKGFYRNFGLEMAPSVNDLEDTLTAELEFMQFLTAKLAQAEDEDTDPRPYLLARRDFLTRHLAVWLPAFRAAVTERVEERFFVALAGLADAFVVEELTAVQRHLAET